MAKKRKVENLVTTRGSSHSRSGRGAVRSLGKGDRPRIPQATDGLDFKQNVARERNIIGGTRDRRVSVRVEGTLIDAAKAATGADSDTEIVRLALTSLAVSDNFGEWLLAQQGRLDAGFEIDD